MARMIDLTDKKYGKLTAIKLTGDSESQMEDWEKKLIIDGLKRLLEVCEICE